MKMFSFQILKQSRKSRARLGLLRTSHGVVETPALVPVATQAAVKTLTSEQASATGSQLLICNTFHLHLRPGEPIVKKAGGLHAFMNWNKPLMTDSGGFQVFSFGFGRDQAVGKILKAPRSSQAQETLGRGSQPKAMRITPGGVFFRSLLDGREIFIGPKESMRIQAALGADMIFAFDECTSPLASRDYVETSLARTHAWAKASLKYRSKRQALFGIVQGSHFRDLRQQSAKFIGKLPFDGFGIGGDLGRSKRDTRNILRWTIPHLPPGKPRHLLGIGYLEDIPAIIAEGIDLFDCTVPTHYARRGIAFTRTGELKLARRSLLGDPRPLDPRCGCPVCHHHSRSYLAHLVRARESTGGTLLTLHNLHYFNQFVAALREKIKKGLF